MEPPHTAAGNANAELWCDPAVPLLDMHPEELKPGLKPSPATHILSSTNPIAEGGNHLNVHQ